MVALRTGQPVRGFRIRITRPNGADRWLQGKARRIDNIASIKAWAGLVGMSGGAVRPPLVSHTRAELDDLAADLATAGLRAAG